MSKVTKEQHQLAEKNAIVAQRLKQAETELAELKKQNSTLSHDKWVLSQEKSELIGKLKQLEKI